MGMYVLACMHVHMFVLDYLYSAIGKPHKGIYTKLQSSYKSYKEMAYMETKGSDY